MTVRLGLKQLLRSPVKLVVYFLITALAAALLCVGLNLEANAQRNVAAAEAAFETVAIPDFSAHIRYDGTLCADSDDPFYAGYLPCFTSEYDFAPLLAAPGAENLDVRGYFGARVNGEGNLTEHAPGDGPRNGMPDDVIIFTVNAAERVTVPAFSGPVAVPVTVTFSVMGTDYYRDELDITSFISGGRLQGIPTADGEILPGPLFDVGAEAADGSFYLEPGRQYIAAVRVGAHWDPTTDVIRADSVSIEVGDAYHNGGELGYDKANGWSLVPGGNAYTLPYVAIAPYKEGFFATERGAYFQEIIDAYRANFNSLNAIATNDLAAMRAFHSGGVHVSQGRAFTDEEYAAGAKVCLVSEFMAELNGWEIGDALSLSFYETEYPFTGKTERFSVFRYPAEGFFDEGGYEIVGLFAGNVVTGDASPRYTQGEGLDALDILLPQKSVSNAPAPVISEYTASIRLKNSAAGDFMAEMAASGLMEEQEGGYQLGLTVYDQGYSLVGPGLRQLSRVSRLTLILALAAAGLAVLVLAVVHALRGRRGVAAMRSLGTKRAQVMIISLAGVALVCLLGACAGAYAGHAISCDVTARVVESAKEDAADTTFTAMMGEGEAKEFEFLLESDPALALVSGGAVAAAFLLCAGILLAPEFRRSPMLLLGAKE